MEILEGNKLIAEFMGAENETGYFQASTIGKTKVPTGRMWMKERFPNNMHLCKEDDLRYHSSWDWIMPVVEKIRNIVDKKEYDKEGLLFYKEALSRYVPIRNELVKINLSNVHYCVVEFILWYNSTLKQDAR